MTILAKLSALMVGLLVATGSAGVVIEDFLVSEEDYPKKLRQEVPSVGADASGNFVVAWADNRRGNFDIYAQRFDLEGVPLGSNFLVSDDVTDAHQITPAIGVTHGGAFVVIWTDGRGGDFDIYAQRFDENGNPVGSNFQVSNDVSGKEQSLPSVAVGSDGRFIIVWQDNRNSTWIPDIYGQIYDSLGVPHGSNFIVNDYSGDSQGFPSVAISGAHFFIICWMDSRNGPFDIYAQKYYSWAYPIGGNFRVDDDTANASQYTSSISADSADNFIFVWQDWRDEDPDIYGQRFNFHGGTQGPNFRVNDDSGDAHQSSPSISVTPSGRFAITWQDFRNGDPDIFAQRYSSTGVPQNSNFLVNDDLASAEQSSPSVASDSDGDFVIAWQDLRSGEWDVYFQRYDSSGAPQEANSIVNDNLYGASQDLPSIAVDATGDFTLAWQDYRQGKWDIYAQRYDSSAVPQGGNFLVNDDTVAGDQYLASVCSDEEGNLVLTWMDERLGDWDVFAQRVDPYGVPQGANFRVNDDTTHADQCAPDVASHPTNGFIITWMGGAIFAQRYDRDGNPIGSNFQVSDTLLGGCYPSIAISDNGEFVICWTAGLDIYAQRYDSAGVPQGGNFLVNDDLVGADQYSPAIGIDSLGNFVITWEDWRDADPNIYAQRYDSSGAPQGGNFLVNDDAWGSCQFGTSVGVGPEGKSVICWMDDRGGDWDIWGQRYSEDGAPHGPNFRVNNDLGPLTQLNPEVVMDKGSRMLIAWVDNRESSHGYDIFAKVLGFSEVGVKETIDIVPFLTRASLLQNYPNPFSRTTTIPYSLLSDVSSRRTAVSLTVYDLSGRLVRVLSDRPQTPGFYTVIWDSRDNSGRHVPSGIYFYRLRCGTCQKTRKAILLR